MDSGLAELGYALEDVVAEVKEKVSSSLDERAVLMAVAPKPNAAKEALVGETFNSSAGFRRAMAAYSWIPDYYVFSELEDFKVPKKFFPQHMTPGVRKLLAVWTEFCRFVMLQVHAFQEFGVGFHFSYDTLASYVFEDDTHWLLLNPYRDLDTLRKMLRISNMDDLASIYASAVHEVTHLATGISTHTEAFSSAMTANMAKTLPGARKIRALAKYATSSI